jgi:hypothetical protein
VNVRQLVDELANALQVAVLVAQHLELASSATAHDASTLTRTLRRATSALQKLRADGGAP